MQAFEYIRAVYKDWVALMSGVASLSLGFLATFTEYAIRHAKAMLWVAAAVCFAITSYRVWAQERSKVNKLKARLTPTLEVLFGTDPPFIQIHETSRNETITHYGIQIRNSGANTAKRIRVQIEGFRQSGVMRSISFFDPNRTRQDVLLDPREKKGVQFVETAPDGLAYLIQYSGRTPLDLGRHDLTIRVLAQDTPAREVKAVLSVREKGIVELTPA